MAANSSSWIWYRSFDPLEIVERANQFVVISKQRTRGHGLEVQVEPSQDVAVPVQVVGEEQDRSPQRRRSRRTPRSSR